MQGLAQINGNDWPEASQGEHTRGHGEHHEKDAGVMKVSRGRRRHASSPETGKKACNHRDAINQMMIRFPHRAGQAL